MFRRGDDGLAARDRQGKVVKDSAGEWDLEVTLLKAYQLRPWEVARLDPDFVLELTARADAENSPAFQKWLQKQAKSSNSKDEGD